MPQLTEGFLPLGLRARCDSLSRWVVSSRPDDRPTSGTHMRTLTWHDERAVHSGAITRARLRP